MMNPHVPERILKCPEEECGNSDFSMDSSNIRFFFTLKSGHFGSINGHKNVRIRKLLVLSANKFQVCESGHLESTTEKQMSGCGRYERPDLLGKCRH